MEAVTQSLLLVICHGPKAKQIRKRVLNYMESLGKMAHTLISKHVAKFLEKAIHLSFMARTTCKLLQCFSNAVYQPGVLRFHF